MAREQAPARRVVVKFADYVKIRYRDHAENDVKKMKLGPWDELVRRFPGITLMRMFTSVAPTRVADLVAEAVALDPTYRPPNFLAYFVIPCPPRIDAEALAAALREWHTVQTAYVDPHDGPATGPAGLNPDLSSQAYLAAGPAGVGALYAWTLANGAGEQQKAIDMERSWAFGHEDLRTGIAPPLFGDIDPNITHVRHGTAIVGLMAMVDNNVGGVGIAFRAAQVKTVSHYDAANPPILRRPEAIMAAIKWFTRAGEHAFGRVLTMPIQILEPVTDFSGASWANMPVESYQAEFDTIRLATALGIVVVEAAGNGYHDLDTYRQAGTGKYIFRRGVAGDFRDSGAIMVGASSSTVPHTRMAFSNHGSRVDCYAWGQNVRTAYSTAADPTHAYTSTFSGTSSATGIIGGVTLVAQGLVQASRNYRLGSWQMRAFLRDPSNGTPSANPTSDRIGVMPDLAKIATALSVKPDLYLRDFVGDNGDPHAGAISASPDIIVRPTPSANPTADFGAGSPTENSDTAGSTVTPGQNNFIYARVKNRGGGLPAAGVTVTVYWAPLATLVTPPTWNLIGTATFPSAIPATNVLRVSNVLPWPQSALPPVGHHCFVALVNHAQDPAPAPASLFDWNTYQQYIRENNNITWRNFNVV